MGWLSGWAYRRQIVVSGVSGAGTNYQIQIIVAEKIASQSVHFSLYGHSAQFPSGKNQSGDIRFTTDDGTSMCAMWVEEVTGTAPNRVARIWIKVPVSLDSDQILYCYYGNSSAGNVSSGENVFLLFDDFEGTALNTDKWVAGRVFGSGSWSVTVSGSEVAIYAGANTTTGVNSLTAYPFPVATGGRFRVSTDSGEVWNAIVQQSLDDNNWVRHGYAGTSSYYYQKRTSGVISTYQSLSRTGPSSGVRWRIRWLLGHSLYLENDAKVNTVTTQDRWASGDNRLYMSLYNNKTGYWDYVYVSKSVDGTIEPGVVWASNREDTQDVGAVSLPLYSSLKTLRWSVAESVCPGASLWRCGDGKINGSVSVLGVPGRRRVSLLDRRSMRVLAVTWSDPVTGAYEFNGFDPRWDYLVICDDYTQTYNAAAADWVKPEVSS